MKDFADIPNTSGSFPEVVATDASPSELRNGTPIIADFVTDIFGAFQSLVYQAGMSPSGSAEDAYDGDIIEAVRRVAGYPGEVVYWAGEAAPDARLIQLAGQVITITSYPKLVTATYIGNGNNADTDYDAFYKCSDLAGLVRDTAGPYFKLPDCRGYFLRSLDDGSGNDAGRDYNGEESIMGNVQGEAYGPHKHNVVDTSANKISVYTASLSGIDPESYHGLYQNISTGAYTATPCASYDVLYSDSEAVSTTVVTAFPQEVYDTGEMECRPANVAFRVMMRY